MTEKDEGKKPRYETPVVVPLGEVAKGAGVCGNGSSPTGDADCTHGSINLTGICTDGAGVLGGACSNGSGGTV
jgi:hypothetical protein